MSLRVNTFQHENSTYAIFTFHTNTEVWFKAEECLRVLSLPTDALYSILHESNYQSWYKFSEFINCSPCSFDMSTKFITETGCHTLLTIANSEISKIFSEWLMHNIPSSTCEVDEYASVVNYAYNRYYYVAEMEEEGGQDII